MMRNTQHATSNLGCSLRHTRAQILEEPNFVCPTLFIDEAKFHISRSANKHNYVIQCSEYPREHLEGSSPEVRAGIAQSV
jgi:hypothetical protein